MVDKRKVKECFVCGVACYGYRCAACYRDKPGVLSRCKRNGKTIL